ncbi:shikimate kinase [Algirhabdus cladophorae]|uniref:shikimate kinase n=1 Tax=Algirhabdus cladophorae TaxID=3377108 RepID=UPI003B84B4EE
MPINSGDTSIGSALKLQKTVVFVGMMGAGKTAVGRAVAQYFDVPFRDSDAALEEAAQMTIAEIFDRDGEAFFRDRETQVIDRLLAKSPSILSTGGGAFMAARNRDLITAKGVSVWLQADLDLLWERVRHKDTRPLLRTADPYGTLKGIYEQRTPIYAEANVTVETLASYSISDTTQAVVQALLAHPGILEASDV